MSISWYANFVLQIISLTLYLIRDLVTYCIELSHTQAIPIGNLTQENCLAEMYLKLTLRILNLKNSCIVFST